MGYLKKVVDLCRKRKKPFYYIVGKMPVVTKSCQPFKIIRKHFIVSFNPSSLSLIAWLYPNDRISEEDLFTRVLKNLTM